MGDWDAVGLLKPERAPDAFSTVHDISDLWRLLWFQDGFLGFVTAVTMLMGGLFVTKR
jgi:hypothetical protein